MIEIGAVKIKNGEIIERFDELINPGRPLDISITEITSITDSMLEDKDNEENVTKRFKEFIGDFPLVAHNAKFDSSMLEMAYSKYKLMKAYSDDPKVCCKQAAHIVRLRDFIYRYDKEVSYAECLIPSNIDYIIDIRTGKYDLTTVKTVANRMLDDIDDLYAIKTATGYNSDVENIMNDVISDILKNYFNDYFEPYK